MAKKINDMCSRPYPCLSLPLTPTAPAIVEPGENTTSEIEEDEFRFFQTECAAFSVTIMIEQIDVVGTCSLYASTSMQNPGPLDPPDVVIRNEDHSVHTRSVLVHFAHALHQVGRGVSCWIITDVRSMNQSDLLATVLMRAHTVLLFPYSWPHART